MKEVNCRLIAAVAYDLVQRFFFVQAAAGIHGERQAFQNHRFCNLVGELFLTGNHAGIDSGERAVHTCRFLPVRAAYLLYVLEAVLTVPSPLDKGVMSDSMRPIEQFPLSTRARSSELNPNVTLAMALSLFAARPSSSALYPNVCRIAAKPFC